VPKTIVFVDDEEHVLHSLRRAFMDTAYDVRTVMDAAGALALMEKERVDLIVSDMRMADMDGYELLKIVKDKWPSSIRIILSGYSDKSTTLKAITRGVAKAYLTKPWDDTALKSQIEHLFVLHDTLNGSGVLETINRIDGLPVLPSLYHTVVEMIENEGNISEIAKVIEEEPGWIARILQVINSAFFGISVSTVHQAITFLGMIIVKDIIISSEVFESVNGQGKGDMHVDVLREHSNVCNRLLHTLYLSKHNRGMPEEFALVGVLHDIGKLLILKYFSVRLDELARERKFAPERSGVGAERSVIGASHAELGAYLLDWWNLPQALVEACLFHHDPLNPMVQNKELVSLLAIADCYSWKAVGKNAPCEIPKGVYEAAGITQTDTIAAVKNLFPEAHE
jgi:HD-like signal output (HDOD) protein